MALIACPVPGKRKSEVLCAAFIEGAPKHAQGFVFYGVKAGNHEQWVNARRSGLDWYFIDNSYFDASRGTYYRVARNQLQHDGVGLTNYDRFGRLGLRIAQHPPGGDKTVIVPQSDDHMLFTLEHADPKKWLKRTMATYGIGQNVKVREWGPNKLELATTLREDLMQARLLVTHTSAAAVEAVLAAVPVVCDRMSAAWIFSRGCMLYDPPLADRTKWAAVLADNQWTVDEMKGGLAWQSLNPK